MTKILFVLLCACLLACEQESQTSKQAPETVTQSSNLRDPGTTTNSTSEREFIQKRYERIENMARRGVLDCDSLSYDCPGGEGGGTFRFCSVDEEMVRATHEHYDAGHGSGSETYYYDGDERFFALLTDEYWRFAGPRTTDPAGSEVPGTEDIIREERRYYAGGNLIDRLYKSYTLRSYAENPAPESIPNLRHGAPIETGLGSDRLREVATTGTYVCE